MPELTLRQAAALCGGTVEERYKDVTFFGAGNDTRHIRQGQLFVALQGARDGHDFIPAAFAAGAGAVLCSRKVGDYPAIVVDDPRIALGQIAHGVLQSLGCQVVAVTGSVGKSTTKEMVASVLETTYTVGKTPANHNNDIGMPMAVLGLKEDTQVAVLEMGMNHFGEIAYLSKIACPHVGVIINVGTAHMEYLGSREGIRKAKLEILEGMAPEGTLLLNGDNDMLYPLPEQPKQRLVYFGRHPGCQVRARDVRQEAGLAFRIEREGVSFPVELPLEGEHFLSDALAAAAVGQCLGVTAENIRKGLETFHNISGRQEILEFGGVTVINDCYNAGPESMAASLAVLGRRTGRRIAVLGEMLELGELSQQAHLQAGRLAGKNASCLLALGPHGEAMCQGAREAGLQNCRSFSDRETLIQALKEILAPGDVILLKGSHGMHLEQVLAALRHPDREGGNSK